MRLEIREIVLIGCTIMTLGSKAQPQDLQANSEMLAVIGRPSSDSIMIRWAPKTISAWLDGNRLGYHIERYLIAKDNKLVNPPAKKLLSSQALKPLSEDQWESLVEQSHYAAIAAQALYGSDFKVDMQQRDVFQIVDKVKENEQRFTFALFCADMSLPVARALALSFTDTNVVRGEKYLYRIYVASPDTLRGSLFIAPDDRYRLPGPRNLTADFGDHSVSLRWEKDMFNHYTAYVLERSSNGTLFEPVSDNPVITVSESIQDASQYEYGADSIPDTSSEYYYRVRGLTPFGETGPASEIVHGTGQAALSVVPHITSAENPDNKSIRLTWEFPEDLNQLTSGFTIARSTSPNGTKERIGPQLLPANSRNFTDRSPMQVNYYTVSAVTGSGNPLTSPSYLAQLVDSIPPALPEQLKASVNDAGVVDLSWRHGDEPDLFGYRVYRARHLSEEFVQLTGEPVCISQFRDTIDLHTLDRVVYYQVMALDLSQNHSALSEPVTVRLPDQVSPQPPVILPVTSDESGVKLSWIRSSSDDVIRYDVYRKQPAEDKWSFLERIPASDDSVYDIRDKNIEPNTPAAYIILAVDRAGLESEPSMPVTGSFISNSPLPAIKWRNPTILKDQSQVLLRWSYEMEGVARYRLYKSINGKNVIMIKSLRANEAEYADEIHPGSRYEYFIMAVLADGRMSFLSSGLVIEY